MEVKFLVLKTSAIYEERILTSVLLSIYSQEINSLHQLSRWLCEPATTGSMTKQSLLLRNRTTVLQNVVNYFTVSFMPHAVREERAKCHGPDPDVSDSLMPMLGIKHYLGQFSSIYPVHNISAYNSSY